MDVMASWTGNQADALRQALRMTNESFAGYLGIAVRTVAYWRARPDVIPRPDMQQILDTALASAPAAAQAHFSLILAERRQPHQTASATSPEDPGSLTAWITESHVSDEAIENLHRAANGLADRHTKAPARQVLAEVLRVHDKTQLLLRSGRLRLRQTRDLLRIEGSTLAHASVLLGDLGQDHQAERYGQASAVFLQEADANKAIAFYALAKTARWQHDYATAADLAQQGFEHGPVTPMSVQLAYYEANCAALLGDQAHARQALVRADQIAAAQNADPADGSPWSFTAQRQAIFQLSVLLRTGDPGGALAAADAADHSWDAGDPCIPGTWAQIRVGAAIAHLQLGALDGAAEQVQPMLTLAPEFRIATVTGWLADLSDHLAQPQFAASRTAVSLRQQIRDFEAAALPPHAKKTA